MTTEALSLDDVKTFEELEQEHGVLFTGKDIKPKEKTKRAEFVELIKAGSEGKVLMVGIDYEFRRKWLKDNGYKETRENLSNAMLPAKTKAV